jgi:hypothetical protein
VLSDWMVVNKELEMMWKELVVVSYWVVVIKILEIV